MVQHSGKPAYELTSSKQLQPKLPLNNGLHQPAAPTRSHAMNGPEVALARERNTVHR